MSGILYVVATPIGNLEDVTFRALRVLREVAVIAAEDTRRTSKLLQHYSISTPTTSLHAHNERARTPALLARLARGESVALVSDAGTPLLSDPGAQLVAGAHAAGVRVEPVPGPSAAMAALSASGFGTAEFVFAGFPPPKRRARREWLHRLAPESRILILYEAPHRVRETLRDMLEIFGDRPICLARELTKAHEELAVQPISDLLNRASEPRGEYTLVVPAFSEAAPREVRLLRDEELLHAFRHLTETEGLARREAVRHVARQAGLTTRETYMRLENARTAGE